MKKKNIVTVIIIAMLAISLVGCKKSSDEKVYKIGVSQFVKHGALDAAYDGFIDALKEAGYEDGKNIKIDYQNAQNDMSTTNTIANKLVNDNNDLILAIATPSSEAVANATTTIPVLVTAVTDPAGSKLVKSNENPGGNISGTSDLNPIDKQLQLLVDLVPDAKKIAILYCSSESNSKIQSDMAIEAAAALGIEAIEATVSNSNDIEQVVQSLVGKIDAIYAPTDNVIALGMPTVALITTPNKIPVICGEEGMVEAGGLATIGINYFKLGQMTGRQAVQIIEGKNTTANMPIEYLPDEEFQLTINEETATAIGIEIPEELK